MGDAYSGIDGSIWYRDLESKFEKLEQIVAEIITEEPHLVKELRKRIEKVIEERT